MPDKNKARTTARMLESVIRLSQGKTSSSIYIFKYKL